MQFFERGANDFESVAITIHIELFHYLGLVTRSPTSWTLQSFNSDGLTPWDARR